MKTTLRYAGLMFAIGLICTSTSPAQWASGPGSVTSMAGPCGPGGCGPTAGVAYGNYPSTGYDAAFGGTPCGNGNCGTNHGYAAAQPYRTQPYRTQPYGTQPYGGQPYAGQTMNSSPAAGYRHAGYPAASIPSAVPTNGYPAPGYPAAGPSMGTMPGHRGGPTGSNAGNSTLMAAQRQFAAYDPASDAIGGGPAGSPPAAPYGGEMVTAPYGTSGSPMNGGGLSQGVMAGPGMAGPGMAGPGMNGNQMPYGYNGGMTNGINGPLTNSSWGDCPVVATAPVRCGPTWFGGIYGLIMNRDDENQQFYLVDPTVANCGCLSSHDADMEWAGGYELRLGRTFCQGAWGVEYVYWQIFPNGQRATATGPGLTGTIDYQDVFLTQSGGDDTAANLFTNGNVAYASLQRDWEFQNIEINLLSRPLYAGCGFFGGGGCGSCCGAGVGGCGGPCGGSCAPPRLRIGWLFGVRYFRFDESWRLTYDNFDNVIDGANPDTEFDHYVGMDNNLLGGQLGLNLDYYVTRSVQLEVGTKFGLLGNRMTQNQQVFNDFGYGYVIPGAPEELNIRSDKTDVAFLGEFRAGLAYKVNCNWRITGGYRAIALSGVALATNQLPFGRSFTNLTSISDIDRNGDLILHGAYGGIEFAW